MTKINLKKEYLSSKKREGMAPKKPSVWQKIKTNPMYQFILFGLILFAIQGLSLAGILPSSFAQACCSTIIYCIVAIGFCLLLGYSGLASLGTAGFIALGSYIGFYTMQSLGLDYIGAFIVTVLISIAIGAVVGFISLRIEGIYLAIMTLALSEMIVKLLKTIKASIKIDRGNVNLFGVIELNSTIMYFLIVIMFVLFTIIIINLINSPTGRAMIAMKSSTSAAQAMGISLMKYRLLAFIISIIYASTAGLLYIMFMRSITTATSTLFTLSTSLYILGAVIIGGAKSIWGTTIGTFFIYGLNTMVLSKIQFFNDNPGIMTIIAGVLMIVIVMFYPGGFAQMAYNIRSKLKQRKLLWEEKRYGKEP